MQEKTGRQSVPDSLYQARQSKLSEILLQARLDGLALNPGPSLTYLTGLHFHLSERPVVGLFSPGKPVVVVHPELEAAKLAQLDFLSKSIPYSEDPSQWVHSFASGMREAELAQGKIGIETLHMRVLELNFLQSAAPEAKFTPANEVIAGLRMRKDATEASAMRTAVKIAQDALHSVLNTFQTGMTERELAAELTLQLLRHGSDPQFPFSPIVSGGPNSANPHASPSDRPIQSGDLLVIDWGAAYNGYISDLTRTFAVETVETEYERIASLVGQANAAGRAACRPGTPASKVDEAARSLIEEAGYGRYFFHRTGHGIGMESHEEPYIRSGNPLILRPGMCFTVEPGIYLTDRGGVRIEDNVMITEEGVECFSDLNRALKILPF